MAARAKFTSERRERLLTLLEAGRTLEEACANVEISRATVTKWAARGRVEGCLAEERSFASRLDGIRAGEHEHGLTERDVIRLLELQARKGSVTAMKTLLDRFKKEGSSGDAKLKHIADPFGDLEADSEDDLAAARRRRSEAS